jgi:D-alanyl-D-alanine carboxypeptidase
MSGIGLEPGDRISIKQALIALIVKSANDAGVTLARAVGGSEARFVALMNQEAARLGLRDTRYTNVTGGVRDSRHRSSVHDLARLARYAMRDARFRDLVRRQKAVVRWGPGKVRTVRVNNLLLHWDWADGVKSGYTPVAGYCLVGSGRPGLRPFISATLHSADRDQDVRDHVALYEWASSLYERRTVVNAGAQVATRPLTGGGSVVVAARTTLKTVVRSAAGVRRSIALPARFTDAPATGTRVGWATYTADGVRLGRVRLVVAPAEVPADATSPAATSAPLGSVEPR